MVRPVLLACALATLGAVLATTPAGAAGRCGAHAWCDTRLSPDERAGLLLRALTRDERISLLAGDELTGVAGQAGTPHRHEQRRPARRPAAGLLQRRPGRARARARRRRCRRRCRWRRRFDRGARAAPRRRRRRRGAQEGQRRRLRPRGEHDAHAAQRPHVRVLRRGPVPGRADGGAAGRKGRAGRRASSATSSTTRSTTRRARAPRSRARRSACRWSGSRLTVDARARRARAARDLPAAVRGGGQGGRRRLGDVLLPRVNGQYACENEHLLDDILKRDWGFRGFVLTDYGAGEEHRRLAQQRARPRHLARRSPTAAELVNAALASGAGQRGRRRRARPAHPAHAVRLRLLRPRGLRRRRRPDRQGGPPRRVRRRSRQQGIVLLENDGGVLPLDAGADRPARASSGPRRTTLRNGGGSSAINPFMIDHAASQGIQARLGTETRRRTTTAPTRRARRPWPRAAERRGRGRRRPHRRGLRQAVHGAQLRRDRRHRPRRADRAGRRGAAAHGRRAPDRRPGAHAVARPRRPVCSRRGTRARTAARRSPACCSATPSPAAACRRPSRCARPTSRRPATRRSTPASASA